MTSKPPSHDGRISGIFGEKQVGVDSTRFLRISSNAVEKSHFPAVHIGSMYGMPTFYHQNLRIYTSFPWIRHGGCKLDPLHLYKLNLSPGSHEKTRKTPRHRRLVNQPSTC